MKKYIILSAITVSVLSAYEAVVLDEIVTIGTATKTQKHIDGVSASVEVVTQKEIEKMGASTLKDIFANVPGLYTQYGASKKSKSSISIRGMGARGTLILVDGRRLGGEVTNRYDLDRIPASSIEKIEIVKGPMSTLYGADATGGVINIITKKPKEGKPQINFGIRYGQNGDGDDKNKNIHLDIKGKENNLGYSVYINRNSTTPYTQKEVADVYVRQAGGPNSGTNQKPSSTTNGTPSAKLKGLNDFYTEDVTYREDSEVLTLGGRLEYDFSDSIKAGIDVNSFKEERDGSYIGHFHPSNVRLQNGRYIPVYNIPVDSNDDNKRVDIGADLEIASIEDLVLKFRAYRSYYKKRNTTTAKYWDEMQYDSKEASGKSGMNANVDIRSYEAIANYMFNENHLLTAGIEKRTEDREATVFTQSNALTSKSVDYKAFYLQDEWMIADDLNVILGARYDDISNANSKATFKLGAVKNFDKAFNLRGNFAQGYRAPDLRELYINKRTPIGLRQGATLVGYDLKPEFTNSYEAGASGKIGNLSYDVAFFYNDIKNMIAEVNKGNYLTYENLSKAKTYGSDLSLKYKLSDSVGARLSWNELRTKDKKTSKELEFNPDRIVSAFLDVEISKSIDTTIGAKYVGSQYYKKTINRGTPTQAITDDKTGGFTTVDWNINYAYNKHVALYGGINNLMDKKIADVLGSSSGRYYFTGMKVTF